MDATDAYAVDADQPLTRLPFPPLRRSHILHCSYHWWHSRYRPITPKARTVALTQSFLDYLRADGIILPAEISDSAPLSDDDSGIFSSTDDAQGTTEQDEDDEDVSTPWRSVHEDIKATIAELGGKVVPKLNWSAPKDATWISATNSMECRSPNDVYLLLKSSDFITHDLEHAFDDCIPITPDEEQDSEIKAQLNNVPYILVLRKFIQLNPSVEFRCFVRARRLIGITQRDLNHFDFLFKLRDQLRDLIQNFFDDKLKHTFPDEDFVFDVYVPPPHQRVWLVDFNPWDQRTDPLLFSWLELLTMHTPPESLPSPTITQEEQIIRLPLRPAESGANASAFSHEQQLGRDTDSDSASNSNSDSDDSSPDSESTEEEEEDITLFPEFRLVERDDPEAYMFNSTRYSAHKLPRDVVDASQSGAGGLREFADNWRDILARRRTEDEGAEDSETE